MRGRVIGEERSAVLLSGMVFAVSILIACGIKDEMYNERVVADTGKAIDRIAISDDVAGFSFVARERRKVFYTKESNNPILSCSYIYSLMENYSNEAAQEQINASLIGLSDEWWESMGSQAVSYESSYLQSGQEWSQIWEAVSSRTITPARIDATMVSFRIEDYNYSGGMHGFSVVYGVTFNGSTGRRLGLDDICIYRDRFEDSCKENVSEYYSTKGVSGLKDVSVLVEEMLERESWYFSEEGFVLCANQYELGGASDGCIEIVIPYELLSGLDGKYTYSEGCL